MKTENNINNFVVYKHYTIDTNELFYIGEGRPKRPFDRSNRNRYWNYKILKHGNDFKVVIVKDNLTKVEAEELETKLIIKHKANGDNIVNFCVGPMFKSHWILNAPKECRPMFGKKNPKASARIKKWNSLHSGALSPVYGMKRPDLSIRNKYPMLHRKNTVEILCVELNRLFNSITDAKKFIHSTTQLKNININRALETGSVAGGYHWKRTGRKLLI